MASPIKLPETLENDNQVPSGATVWRAGERNDWGDDGDDGDDGASRAMTKLSIVPTDVDGMPVPNSQKDGDEDSKNIEPSASHLNQRLKFLLDSSTIQFCDAIVQEGYRVMPVAMVNLSRIDVLRFACVFGLALLTLDRGYLSVAHGTNMYGVLVLPEIFVSVDQNQEQKTTWLCELLRCQDELNKIRLFPIRPCVAKKEEEEWVVEEVASQEVEDLPNTDGSGANCE